MVFSTGGLGPTQDDLTREAISSALGEEMQVDPGLLEDLKAWFRYRGADMPPRNTKQATLIPSAVTIPNNQGTAPGWWVERKGKIIVAMPGPPGEMYNMWQNQVAPKLGGKVRGQVIITRNIKTTDLAEADVAERVARFAESANPYLGIYAKHDGIHLRIIGRGASEEEARALIEPVESGILEIMGPHVWGFDDDSPEGALAEALSEAGLTVATMESCTGGLMASTITDVPGSSAYFRGGIVSYSNEAKIANGVPAEVIRDHGGISAETAEAMAKAARRRTGGGPWRRSDGCRGAVGAGGQGGGNGVHRHRSGGGGEAGGAAAAAETGGGQVPLGNDGAGGADAAGAGVGGVIGNSPMNLSAVLLSHCLLFLTLLILACGGNSSAPESTSHTSPPPTALSPTPTAFRQHQRLSPTPIPLPVAPSTPTIAPPSTPIPTPIPIGTSVENSYKAGEILVGGQRSCGESHWLNGRRPQFHRSLFPNQPPSGQRVPLLHGQTPS